MTYTDTKTALATVSTGTLRGTLAGGLAVFHAVPYAERPTGALRFRPPQPMEPWSGERDATTPAAIAPQLPARLTRVMGGFEFPQSEDCLNVTIWTPANDGARRPVMVWFHGGAWVSGGTIPLYSGANMAARGDVVVVGVNSRLGALGYLYLPGISPGNLGVLDQIAALQWVNREIVAFGGDPENITIFGQSAGGFTMLAMLGTPQVRACFRRAIVQSAPFSPGLRSVEEATLAGTKLGKLLGIGGNDAWADVSPAAILEAQREVMRGDGAFANPRMPFGPVADGKMLDHRMFERAAEATLTHAVMIGYTRHDARAFLVTDERMRTTEHSLIISRFKDYFGDQAEQALAEYRERSGEPASSASPLLDMLTDAFFAGAILRFKEQSSDKGGKLFAYRFDWSPPTSNFGACHCIELPFVFNNLEQWSAPMLAGGDGHKMQSLADRIQDAWIAFAHVGNPGHSGLPEWPTYDRLARHTMLFDAHCQIEQDPAGRSRWRYWP